MSAQDCSVAQLWSLLCQLMEIDLYTSNTPKVNMVSLPTSCMLGTLSLGLTTTARLALPVFGCLTDISTVVQELGGEASDCGAEE